MGIAQGATPYVMLFVEGYDLRDAEGIMLVIKTQEKALFFDRERVTVTGDGNESLVMVHLTQQETLSISPGRADTQLRWRDGNNESYTSDALPLEVRTSSYKGVV